MLDLKRGEASQIGVGVGGGRVGMGGDSGLRTGLSLPHAGPQERRGLSSRCGGLGGGGAVQACELGFLFHHMLDLKRGEACQVGGGVEGGGGGGAVQACELGFLYHMLDLKRREACQVAGCVGLCVCGMGGLCRPANWASPSTCWT